MATSIARRIKFSLLGLALGLSLVFAGLTLLLLYVTEDRVFANQLEAERKELVKLRKDELKGWRPASRHMVLYLQRSELPDQLQTKVGELTGIYEYFDENSAFFILVGVLPQVDQQPFFLTYDVSRLLAVRSSRSVFVLLVGFGALLVLLAAVVLALYLSRTTLRPLKRLTDHLQLERGDELPAGFSANFEADEIGVLAQSLESAIERVQSSVHREFEFNRDVSHELRTPIQIAKTALELIEVSGSDPSAELTKPMQRLQRSIAQMETITEAFLWLASEKEVSGAMTDAKACLEQVVVEQRHLLAGKSVDVDTHVADGLYYQIPEPVLKVVIGNLLRNAIQHTDQGSIDCRLTANEILVEDTGIGPGNTNGKSEGFGVGLVIVNRVCERFGWDFELLQRASGGARARIQTNVPDKKMPSQGGHKNR